MLQEINLNTTIVSSVSAVDKFDYKGLQNALEQLADFEKKENARVVQFAVLKGLNIEDIKNAGKRLILQDGCRRFFQRIVKDEIMKTDVHVLSYCWCGDLIRSAFSSGKLCGTFILYSYVSLSRVWMIKSFRQTYHMGYMLY